MVVLGAQELVVKVITERRVHPLRLLDRAAVEEAVVLALPQANLLTQPLEVVELEPLLL